MKFNSFNMYSLMGEYVANKTIENETDIEFIKTFDNIKCLDEVKKILNEKFDISEPVKNLPISSCCTLTTNDTEKYFSVEFYINNESIVYSYIKRAKE